MWCFQVTIIRTWQTRRLLARAWQALLAVDVPEAERLAMRFERSRVAPVGDAEDCITAVLTAALRAVQDDSTAALALARRALHPCADVECRALATMICRWAHWRAGELNEFHSAGRAQWRTGLRRDRKSVV